MPIYRFRILDEFDHVIAGQYSHCKDDDAARRHANILAALSRNSNIEIWDCDLPVLRTPGPRWARAVENRRLRSNDRRRQVRQRAGPICQPPIIGDEQRWGGLRNNCPRCKAPDVLAIRWPTVQCLACGCTYEFD